MVAGEYVEAFRDHPLTEIVGIYNHAPGKATGSCRRTACDAPRSRSGERSPRSPCSRRAASFP